MNALFNCSETLNALIVFNETINYKILKPRKEFGMDVCTKQYDYWVELPDIEFKGMAGALNCWGFVCWGLAWLKEALQNKIGLTEMLAWKKGRVKILPVCRDCSVTSVSAPWMGGQRLGQKNSPSHFNVKKLNWVRCFSSCLLCDTFAIINHVKKYLWIFVTFAGWPNGEKK